jgi:uncharacterized protein YeaO (DUF488 family)
MALKLRTFQIGTPAKRGDGLRIGATRHPPRGVPRNRWQKNGYFDTWFPVVAPSRGLLRRAHAGKVSMPEFFDAYEREVLSRGESRQAVTLLAEVAKRTPISIGCYCPDERHCHRSRLKRLIERAAKRAS